MDFSLLPKSEVAHMAVGNDGSIWYSSSKFHAPAPPSNTPPGGDVFKISPSGDITKVPVIGRILAPVSDTECWVGQADGNTFHISGQPFAVKDRDLSGRGVYDISVASDGTIWATNVPYADPPGPNLWQFSKHAGKWELFSGEGWNVAGLSKNEAFVVYKDDKIDIWGALAKNSNGTVHKLNRYVHDVDVAPDGTVWIADNRNSNSRTVLMSSTDGGTTWQEKSDLLSHVRVVCAYDATTAMIVFASGVVEVFTG